MHRTHHHERLAPRLDFRIPRLAVGIFQAATLVIGCLGALAALIVETSAYGSAMGFVAALIHAVLILLGTGMTYAILSGLLAVFQIADDTRELLVDERGAAMGPSRRHDAPKRHHGSDDEPLVRDLASL